MRFVNKVHIKPSKNQIETFNFWLRKCKDLYNGALEHRSEVYRKTGKGVSYYDQKKELPLIKIDNSIWSDVPNKSLTETLKRLDNSFNRFFKNGAGYPKFKNNDNFNSIYFVSTDVKLKNNLLYLPKIKTPISYSEAIKDDFKSVVLKKENNQWFLIFNYDDKQVLIKDELKDKELESVGVDLGLKTLLTDSEGNEVKRFSTKLLKKYANRIVELNQSLSRCKKGSKRRKKVKKQLTKAYLRQKNSVQDYQKKEANKYVNKLLKEDREVLIIGDIQVGSIIDKSKDVKKSKRALRRSFSRNSVTQFKTVLTNKAESKGIRVYKVSEWKTSQTCSCCGAVKDDLKLSDRVFGCGHCGASINRDRNGAINMKIVWHGQFKPYGLDSHGKKVYCVKKSEYK